MQNHRNQLNHVKVSFLKSLLLPLLHHLRFDLREKIVDRSWGLCHLWCWLHNFGRLRGWLLWLCNLAVLFVSIAIISIESGFCRQLAPLSLSLFLARGRRRVRLNLLRNWVLERSLVWLLLLLGHLNIWASWLDTSLLLHVINRSLENSWLRNGNISRSNCRVELSEVYNLLKLLVFVLFIVLHEVGDGPALVFHRDALLLCGNWEV